MKKEVFHVEVGSPYYELKRILIYIRLLNQIPDSEMSNCLGISAKSLNQYESNSTISRTYTKKYIKFLEEYVELASKQGRNFEDALIIYMHQKNLNKYSRTYKLALFSLIFYDNLYVNFEAVEESLSNETKSFLAGAEFIPLFEEPQDNLWSNDDFKIAFYILKFIRQISELQIREISNMTSISITTIRNYEGTSVFKLNSSNLHRVIKRYARCLTNYLKEEKNIECDVMELIQNVLEQKFDLNENFKIITFIMTHMKNN